MCYNLLNGLDKEIVNGKYIKEYGDLFEKFVDLFGLGGDDVTILKRYIGHLAAKPYDHMNCAILIASNAGFGKNTLFNIIRKFYLPSVTAETTVDRLIGNFNIDVDKLLVCVDECSCHSSKISDRFKELITAEQVKLNNKNEKCITLKNRLNIMCFSNSFDGFPIDIQYERRGILYNLMSVPKSKSKVIIDEIYKYFNETDFISSCYHKALEWYDSDYLT